MGEVSLRAHAEIECIDGGARGNFRALRDGEDDHDIKNDDKLEGNSSSNCDFSYFKDKAFFLLVEDNGSHCKNIIGGIVEKFSRRVGGGEYSVNPWVGRCDPAPHTLVLFKTNSADFPTLFETEFRFFVPCLIEAFVV